MTSRHRSRSRSRSESKELTRQALLRAALKLLPRNSFDSISLREITREAGVSPTAFYRHFDDTEELGLALVEEAFGSLRQMMRDARADPAMTRDAINRSIETVVVHVHRHTDHMRFIARERYGGVRRLRQAIRRELELFSEELAIDLSVFPALSAWPPADRRMFADLITDTMVSMAAELVETRSPEGEDEIVRRKRQQLLLITLGVDRWSPHADPEDAGHDADAS
jgi:AcrR family transcriptional regulator